MSCAAEQGRFITISVVPYQEQPWDVEAYPTLAAKDAPFQPAAITAPAVTSGEHSSRRRWLPLCLTAAAVGSVLLTGCGKMFTNPGDPNAVLQNDGSGSGGSSESPYDPSSDITGSAGLTASQLNELVAGTGMAGLGADFLALEQTDHINALFALEHAWLESSVNGNPGTSRIARNKNNIFGIGADDSNPYNDAHYFNSKADCIAYYGRYLHKAYLTSGGEYYHGTTMHDVFIDYSSSHDTEANEIAQMMDDALKKLGK